MSLAKACLRKIRNINIHQVPTSTHTLSRAKYNSNINKPFLSPFIITAIHQNKSYQYKHRHQNNTNYLWLSHMYQFCNKSPSNDTNKPSNETIGGKPYIDTEEIQPSKINDKPQKMGTWQKIKQYGVTGIVIYSGLWFGMYGIFYALMHLKFIDIANVADYMPFYQERINNALSSKWGVAMVALIVNESAELVRLPFAMLITPPIARYFQKNKQSQNPQQEQESTGKLHNSRPKSPANSGRLV